MQAATACSFQFRPPSVASAARIVLNTRSGATADEAVVDRLVRAIVPRRVAPAKAVADDEDNPADPHVIDTRHPRAKAGNGARRP